MARPQQNTPLELHATLQEKALILNRLHEGRPLEQQSLLDAITTPELFPQQATLSGRSLAEYKLRALASQQLPDLEAHYPATRHSLARERALYDIGAETQLLYQHYADALQAEGEDKVIDFLLLNRQYESIFGQADDKPLAERLSERVNHQDFQTGDANDIAAALINPATPSERGNSLRQLTQQVTEKLLPTLAKTAERWLDRAGEMMAEAGEFTRNELTQAVSGLNDWANDKTLSRVKTFAHYAAIAAVSIGIGTLSPDAAHADIQYAQQEFTVEQKNQLDDAFDRGLTPEGSGYYSLTNQPEAMLGAIPYNTINAEWLRDAFERSRMEDELERMDRILGEQRYLDQQDLLKVLDASSYEEYQQSTRYMNFFDSKQLHYFMETHAFSPDEAKAAPVDYTSSKPAPGGSTHASLLDAAANFAEAPTPSGSASGSSSPQPTASPSGGKLTPTFSSGSHGPGMG